MLNADALKQLKSLKKEIHSNRNLATGKVKGTTSKFGFVTLSDTGKDVYLSPEEMLKVFPGDEIEVEIFNDGKKKDYAVIQKLIRSDLKIFTGSFKAKNKACFAEPDVNGLSRWLFIPPNKLKGAKEGDLLKCRVTQHPIRTGKPQVEVLEVIGNSKDPFIERTYTASKYNLSNQWSKKIEDLVSQLPDSVNWEAAKRQDLRDTAFVTIDSASTQDMDDALYAEKTESGWKLQVAIADPTEFIAPGSAIEKEAQTRATAVYYPGQVISMLPEVIANQLSSLVEGEDRLTLLCTISVSADGSIENYEITEAVINSKAKLSYDSVASFLNDAGALKKADNEPASEEATKTVQLLAELFPLLNKWRYENALINDDRNDYRLKLNDKGKIDSVQVIKPTRAHKIVEECMIAANMCAADFMKEKTEHGLFITHQGVRKERKDAIQKIIDEKVAPQHGEDAINASVDSLDGYKQLVQAAERTQAEVPLRTIINRQLERSQLSSSVEPHFGMGLSGYTNFTSPIRKFNDFYVHRVIKNKINDAPFHPLSEDDISALQTAQLDAKQATNENENWLKWQYFQNKKGEVFEGSIQRSNSAGFFVKLNENGIEGFVSTKDMPEKYSFDQAYMTLKSKSRGFSLDQKIKVKLLKIDKSRNQIIFDVVEENTDTVSETKTEETAAEK